MPDLFAVACHFDDISVTDAYTGAAAFQGQFSSFNESAPDGTVAKKRTLSVRPGTAIPARRVIGFLGETWIVGDGNVDGIYDAAIRQAHWMKKVTTSAELLTPAQVCAGTTGYVLYVSKDYLKDTVNGVTDTEYDPFWDIYAGMTEAAPKGSYLKIGATLFRVRGSHTESSGFLLVQCDEIDSNNIVTLTVQTGSAFDPITDTFTGGSATVTGIRLEPSKFYRYATQADPRYNSGDVSCLVGSTLSIGTTVTISGLRYRVMAVQPELDAFNLHLRVN